MHSMDEFARVQENYEEELYVNGVDELFLEILCLACFGKEKEKDRIVSFGMCVVRVYVFWCRLKYLLKRMVPET